jgi:phosphoribosylanthranilate isomerase
VQDQTFVKICGITRLSDARVAVRSGANAVGFVFAPSPRHVTVGKASRISAHVHPSVRKFGVFVNASVDKVIQIVLEVDLDSVQLQGDEGADVVEMLKKRFPALFVSTVIKPRNAQAMQLAPDFPADAIFFDPNDVKHPEAASKPVRMSLLRTSPRADYVVSGGLTPENVGRLVKKLRPWGVDVSSGVESAPGKKDHDKVRAFIRAVRQADATGARS